MVTPPHTSSHCLIASHSFPAPSRRPRSHKPPCSAGAHCTGGVSSSSGGGGSRWGLLGRSAAALQHVAATGAATGAATAATAATGTATAATAATGAGPQHCNEEAGWALHCNPTCAGLGTWACGPWQQLPHSSAEGEWWVARKRLVSDAHGQGQGTVLMTRGEPGSSFRVQVLRVSCG